MNENWKELSSQEKSDEMLGHWFIPTNIDFRSNDSKKVYQERAKRVKNAIRLEAPDIVPFWLMDAAFFRLDMSA